MATLSRFQIDLRARSPFVKRLSAFVAAMLIAAHPGCGGKSPVAEPADEPEAPAIEELRSKVARKTTLSASDVKLDDLVRGNSAFALALFGTLRGQDGNLFYSPHSISVALAMMYAGARGETARQMEEVLRFQLPADQLHPAFNVLDLELSTRGQEGGKFRLNIANAIWGQKGYGFLSNFLDTLAENYGAGMRAVDFVQNPEASRTAINDWVSERTEDRIQDLIPEGLINHLTRLVLTNAIYFKAAWRFPFDEDLTTRDPFHLLSGDRVHVPTMHRTETFNYTRHETYQVEAAEMLYAGEEASLMILLPAAGHYDRFENALSEDLVSEISQRLRPIRLMLSIPSFEFESEFRLGETLAGMGMADAFNPESADFSGMADSGNLYLSSVVHKAFVKVDERGTEAAAATGGTIGVTSMPPSFKVDRPFIFLIRDNATEAILFVGRVRDPSQ